MKYEMSDANRITLTTRGIASLLPMDTQKNKTRISTTDIGLSIIECSHAKWKFQGQASL
jgi:hypothetical protein